MRLQRFSSSVRDGGFGLPVQITQLAQIRPFSATLIRSGHSSQKKAFFDSIVLVGVDGQNNDRRAGISLRQLCGSRDSPPDSHIFKFKRNIYSRCMYPLLSYLEYRTSVAVFATSKHLLWALHFLGDRLSEARASPFDGPDHRRTRGIADGESDHWADARPRRPQDGLAHHDGGATSSPTTSEPSGSPVVPLRANVVTTLRNVPARDMTPRETEKYIELLIVGPH